MRDLDAHSWVEVWYAGYGWVTMDPTPAAAPARSQADEDAGRRRARHAGRAGPRRRHPLGRRAAALAATGGGHAVDADRPRRGRRCCCWPALGLWLLRRHRRRVAAGWGPVAELERALARTRRAPGPAATLSTVEAALRAHARGRGLRARAARAALRRPRRPRRRRPGGARSARELARGERPRRAAAGLVGAAAEAALIRRRRLHWSGRWTTSTTSSSAGPHCSRRGTSTPPRCR